MEITAYHPFKSEKAKAKYLKTYDERAKKWPVATECRMVDTSYGQTFVRISGPADAQPLVLLPGLHLNSLMWMTNIKELSECYKTYALDCIWDYGRSVYTRTFKDLNDFVKWLDELFNALELGDSINLMGMSYGGLQTVQYALRFPNRLKKIVLLAPAAIILPISLGFYIYAILSLLPHRYFTKNMLYWLFEDVVKKDEESRMQVEELIDDMFMGSRCFKTLPIIKPTVLDDTDLQNIKVPTLYLVGENEKIHSGKKAIQRLNNVAPHIETKLIPNAGHGLLIVQAEMVNKKVIEFLKQS